MILVIGATGNVGSKLVEQLATMGHQVRALVRSPAKATRIQELGVEIVPGDLECPDMLDAALKGVEKVFLLSSDDPRQGELQGNLIEAAQRGAVRQVVKLSAFTAAPDSPVSFARWHWQTEQQLLASGLASTILRPTLYMQNLVTFFAQSIAAQGLFVLPMKEGKVSQVDARDIAAVAARAHRGGTRGQDLYDYRPGDPLLHPGRRTAVGSAGQEGDLRRPAGRGLSTGLARCRNTRLVGGRLARPL